MSDRDLFKAALGPSPGCPPLEALTGPRAPEVQKHFETCAHCQNEWSLYQEFESAEPRPEEVADVRWIQTKLARRNQSTFWDRLREWFVPSNFRAWAAAAAALLVVIGASVLVRHNGEPPLPSAESGVMRSGRFTAIAPAGELTQPPAEVRWDPVDGAVSYEVRLMEVDRTVIWASQTARTTVEFPQSVTAQFRPGRAFTWRAIARNAAGETIASTDLQSFHILVTTR